MRVSAMAALVLAASCCASDWTASPVPTPWAITPDARCTTLYFEGGSTFHPNFDVVHAELVESATKRRLTDAHFSLQDFAPQSRARGISLSAGGFKTASLCVEQQPAIHGNYTGRITLGAPGAKAIVLNNAQVAASSFRAKAAGFALLTASALLAWYLKQYTTNRISRAQALLGIAVLRASLKEAASSIEKVRAAFPGSIPELERATADLLNTHLTEAWADKNVFVHPRVPFPGTVSVRTSEYGSFLERMRKQVDLIRAVVLPNAVDVVTALHRGTPESACRAVLGQLDDVFTQAPQPMEAAKLAKAAVAGLPRNGMAPAGIYSMQDTGSERADLAPGRLLAEVNRMSVLAWAGIIVVTILTGWLTLILRNAGFGNPIDYVLCTAWGLGVPVATGAIAPALGRGSTLVAGTRYSS